MMSWTPDEGSFEINLERTNLAGSYLEIALYGIHTLLFYICSKTLLSNRRRTPQTSYAFFGYIAVVFFIGTIGAVARGRRTQEALIDNRDYPGGPAAYLLSPPSSAASLNALDTATFAINTWLVNGFMLYRLRILWNERRWMCVVPFLSLLLSIVSSCLYINEVARNLVLWRSVYANVDFALLFWASTTATAIYLTIGIMAKTYILRRKLAKAAGWDLFAPYISTSALFIESGTLSAIFLICMLAAYARDSSADLVFLGLVSQMMCISVLLIVLRVARGDAWSISKAKEMLHEVANLTAFPMDLCRDSTGRTFMQGSDVGGQPSTVERMR